MKAGLIERIQDHKGGAARQHRPTEEGSPLAARRRITQAGCQALMLACSRFQRRAEMKERTPITT